MGKTTGRLTKKQFSELLKDVWTTGMISSNIISGFVTTGICPVDAKRFPEELFDPVLLEVYKNKGTNSEKSASQLPSDSPRPECSSNSHVPSILPDSHPQSSCLLTSPLASSNTPQNHPSCSSACYAPPNLPDQGCLSHVSLDALQPSSSSNLSLGHVSSIKSVVEIFSNIIQKKNNKNEETTQGPRKVVPRLKQAKYGEVLTSTEVLERLRAAETNKKIKNDKN